MVKQSSGLHTCSVGMSMTARQYYRTREHTPALQQCGADYWSEKERYISYAFENKGIVIYLSKFPGRNGAIYRLKVRIEPCRVLGSDDPTALYQPTKKSYRKLVKTVDKLLKKCCLPCSVDEMKVSRTDLTVDMHLESDALVHAYIRFLQKGWRMCHYEHDKFRENEKKAKDSKTANQYSCRLKCKAASFTAYDKIAQLKMVGRYTSALDGQCILRLEANLGRDARKKRIGKQPDVFHDLRESAKKADKVLNWYIRRILRNCTGAHLRYEDAVEQVQSANLKSKTKDRMLCLLRKTSDSKSLSAAMEKTQIAFGLSKPQIERVFWKLNKLGINPLTLRNDAQMETIKALTRVV